MQLIITTPTQTTTYEGVLRVRVPTSTGVAVICPRHAEYVTAVVEGVVMYTTAEGTVSVDITDGVCYVYDDVVRVVL